MYICISHNCEIVKAKLIVESGFYRIYDTIENTYNDVPYDTLYNIINQGTFVGNLCIKKRKLAGDGIDLWRLIYNTNFRSSLIINHIRSEKTSDLLGYEVVYQNGERSFYSCDEAIEKARSNVILNATIVNNEFIRLINASVVETRFVDDKDFTNKAEKELKKRKKARDKAIREFNTQRQWEVDHPEEYRKQRLEEYKKETGKDWEPQDEIIETSSIVKDNRVKNAMDELSTPGPLQGVKAIWSIFKR